MFWEARVVLIRKEWKEFCPDMALRIRRPIQGEMNSEARHVPIKAYSSVDAATPVHSYYLKLDSGLAVAQRRVNGAWEALEGDVPPDCMGMHLLKRDLHSTSGFPSLLNRSV